MVQQKEPHQLLELALLRTETMGQKLCSWLHPVIIQTNTKQSSLALTSNLWTAGPQKNHPLNIRMDVPLPRTATLLRHHSGALRYITYSWEGGGEGPTVNKNMALHWQQFPPPKNRQMRPNIHSEFPAHTAVAFQQQFCVRFPCPSGCVM